MVEAIDRESNMMSTPAKDLMIDYERAWESPQVEQARRLALSGVLRRAIPKEDAMRVYNESRYLKHQDLNGADMVLTIARVTREEIQDKDGTSKKKFILYFKELEKGLVLNTTNMNTLYAVLKTDESDEWIGKRITLYEKDDIEMGGEIKSGIRVRPKAPL